MISNLVLSQGKCTLDMVSHKVTFLCSLELKCTTNLSHNFEEVSFSGLTNIHMGQIKIGV